MSPSVLFTAGPSARGGVPEVWRSAVPAQARSRTPVGSRLEADPSYSVLSVSLLCHEPRIVAGGSDSQLLISCTFCLFHSACAPQYFNCVVVRTGRTMVRVTGSRPANASPACLGHGFPGRAANSFPCSCVRFPLVLFRSATARPRRSAGGWVFTQ